MTNKSYNLTHDVWQHNLKITRGEVVRMMQQFKYLQNEYDLKQTYPDVFELLSTLITHTVVQDSSLQMFANNLEIVDLLKINELKT